MIDLNSLISPIEKILGKFIADKDLRTKLEYELKSEIHKANLAQLEVNKAEAAHKSIFVAGWRPFIGWVCGFALLWHFILNPFLYTVLSLFGYNEINLPEFDFAQLSTILMGMLGLGGLRTFEKTKGVSREK